MREFFADLLILFGTLTMTFGVIGTLRAPTIYTRIHAASKSVVLGVVSLCASAFIEHGSDVRMRVVLIALFLILTTPVSAHVLAQSAHRTGDD